MKIIVEKIKKACSGILPHDIYFINLKNVFILQGNSTAIDNHNGHKELVSVLYWFDNFYIYIIIHFIQLTIESKFGKGFNKKYYFESLKEKYLSIGSNFYNVVVSISVFQGGEQYSDKKQLFRAEWDNYESNKFHPQPHWHFYSEEKDTNKFEVNEIDLHFLQGELQKNIDIKRVHFAMNGQWSENRSHIHRINNQDAIINWFPGLLSHIKGQLEETKKVKR